MRRDGGGSVVNLVLATIFAPENLFVNGFAGLVSLVPYLFMAWMLPPKSPRTYWAVCIGMMAGLSLFRPLYTPLLRIALMFLTTVVVPMMLLGGSFPRRLIVMTVCLLLQSCAEMIGAGLWVLMTGLGTMDNSLAWEYPLPFLLTGTVGHLVCLPLMLAGMMKVYQRWFPLRKGDGGAGEATPSWLVWYSLFPLTQLFLLIMIENIVADHCHGDLAYTLAILALFVLCFAADGLLAASMAQSAKKEQADFEAAALEKSVAACLKQVKVMEAELMETSRLRHDLRNHVQVAQLLAVQGQYEAARAYLAEASLVRETR